MNLKNLRVIPVIFQNAIFGLLLFTLAALKKTRNRGCYYLLFSKLPARKSSRPKPSILKDHGYIWLIIHAIIFCFLLNSCTSSDHSKNYQGYVEGENLYLASPYSGVLKQLLVSRGEQVKQGQLLFILDDNPQILSIKQNEADLSQAERTLNDLEQPRRIPEIEAIKAQIAQADAEMKLAEVRVQRYTELLKKNFIAKDTLDAEIARYKEQERLKAQYEANLQLARLGSRNEQIKAQEAQVLAYMQKLKQAKWELAQKTILAPADGFIFDVYYRVGEFVPNQQAVLSLLPPNNVRIEFFIPVELLSKIQKGQKVQFQCDGCEEKAEAVINYISPEAQFIPPLVYSRDNNHKLVFRIRAAIQHPDQFKPGQPVRVFLP